MIEAGRMIVDGRPLDNLSRNEAELAKRDGCFIMRCLYCGREHMVDPLGYYATGVFNLFCKTRECEDSYAGGI